MKFLYITLSAFFIYACEKASEKEGTQTSVGLAEKDNSSLVEQKVSDTKKYCIYEITPLSDWRDLKVANEITDKLIQLELEHENNKLLLFPLQRNDKIFIGTGCAETDLLQLFPTKSYKHTLIDYKIYLEELAIATSQYRVIE